MDRLHVFLSSPGDVSRERQLAREVLDQLESERTYRDRLKLEVVAWDKPGAGTAMPAQMEPQEAIDKGLRKPSECDIVVVIFWSRMGTPLSDKHRKPDGSRYRSGTEYEFVDAMNSAKTGGKPDVLVYRCLKAPSVRMDDPERNEKNRQWDLVEAFFAEFQNPDGSFQSFYKGYSEPHEFLRLLERDLRDLIGRHFETSAPETPDHPQKPEPSWDKSKPPFPGLRPFTPKESPIFYSRDREIDQLIQILGDPESRFTAVVGASGSGKSSLVAAGLMPALANDALPGSKDWIWLRFTPAEVSDDPFTTLATAFKSILEGHGVSPREMARDLAENPSAASRFFTMALENKPQWTELLLFIDQFEEFFTLVDAKYTGAFVDLLALVAETARVRAVVTMRSDFYHRCLDSPVLTDLLAEGHYPLGTPNVGALYEMINRPAERVGFRFEDGLANRILDDTGAEPGALALMAFALYELWKRSEGTDGLLTHEVYESFGGVQGAIGERAETIYSKLKGEADLDKALSAVFRELVEVDERGVPTRRRARKREITENPVADSLVDEMIQARLLVTGETEENEPIVEVAHEAIFTHWPRLENWIEVARDDLRLLRQVRLAAAEWEESRFENHFLWPHERLVLAAQMKDRMRPTLSPTEEAFIRPESERLRQKIDNPATTLHQRVKIGDRLAEIGDTRPGVGLRDDGLPDIAWCAVPGGEIILGNDAGTFRVEPFYIAKYPVTWIQYRVFLDAEDGYRNKGWWESPADRENEPGTQYRRQDNHPADNVSWTDAVACCRWLSAKLGYAISLPTEWEWQQAATGGDRANTYPWGAAWDLERANTHRSGLSRTTAVGLYPRGASPVGALDMSGNVREWCLNAYEKPENIGIEGKRNRVVRGGSWYSDPNDARAAYRGSFYPNLRFNSQGFRVRCASPIL